MVDLQMPFSNYNGHIPHSASKIDSYNWTFPGDFNAASSVDPQDSTIKDTSTSPRQMCFFVGSEKQMD